MKEINLKKNKGFVILFAVTLSAILLSIALGVMSVAQKEIRFGTSAKDAGDALFAADTGIECALVNDKSIGGVFITPASPTLTCNNSSSITTIESPTLFWSFTIPGLGNGGQGCAKVTVDKRDPLLTSIISKGYNVGSPACNSTSSNKVERELKSSYLAGVPNIIQDVVWQNVVGESVSGNSLTKTAPLAWGNAGASSVQAITSGDGYVEFSTSEADTSKMGGLSNGDSNQDYTDIDYAIYPVAGGNLMVYEKGTNKGTFGTYVPGDIFRVASESGVIKYYKNGALVYTSLQSPVYPLLFDTASYVTGSTIINAKISGL